jgi:hypothetical protein
LDLIRGGEPVMCGRAGGGMRRHRRPPPPRFARSPSPASGGG